MAKGFSFDAVQFLILIYKTAGKETLRRAVTFPEADVRAACASMGSDPEEAIAARNAWTEATVRLIEEIALAD